MTLDLIRRMTFYAGPLRIDIGGGAPFRCLALTKVNGKWTVHPRRNGRAGWEVAVRKKSEAASARYATSGAVQQAVSVVVQADGIPRRGDTQRRHDHRDRKSQLAGHRSVSTRATAHRMTQSAEPHRQRGSA
jgi:hypothetical protein